MQTLTRIALSSLAVALLQAGAIALAQEGDARPEPGVVVTAITITPENPAADTLCRLTVRLTNNGDEVASQLGFRVEINGSEVPVYTNQLFMYPLQPGASSELALFNFWSTETSRPMPKDGKLRVEVALNEAQWTKIEDVEGVETWTPLGPVSGLPSSSAATLEMSR